METRTNDYNEFIVELKRQWKMLWRDRVDDKMKAEGIANKDYPMLDVERGRVIIATRSYKPVDFVEVLQKYKPSNLSGDAIPPSPSVGGWGKFMRDVLNKQKRFTRRGRPVPSERERKDRQQCKKGGRGWLHFIR